MRFSFALVPAQGEVFTTEAAASLGVLGVVVHLADGDALDRGRLTQQGRVISAILQANGSLWVTVEIS